MPDYYERNFGLTKKLPQTGSVFFDVGANEGAWALTLAPGYTKVHAFEPDIRAVLQLHKNIKAAHLEDKIIMNNYALSCTEGLLTLALHDNHVHTRNYDKAPPVHDDPSVGPVRVVATVQCCRLDTVLQAQPELDLSRAAVKIDVEGSELDVLIGAEGLLYTFHPALLVEIHSQELKNTCLAYLARFEYDCEVIRHPDYKPNNPNYDNHLWLNCRKKT